jgi:hypothetical protein
MMGYLIPNISVIFVSNMVTSFIHSVFSINIFNPNRD